jgi:glucokinase
LKEVNVGLDLGGSFLKYGWGVDSIEGSGRVAVGDPEREHIYGLIRETLGRISRESGASIRGVALGAPGCVNPETGEVLGIAPNLEGWEGARPGDYLRSIGYNLVRVENDANLMVYGEAGEWNYTRDVLGVTIGTGIGSGFVRHGEIIRGAGFGAFEIGHIIAVPNGRPCNCGKRGCLEQYTAVPAFWRIARNYWEKKKIVNSVDRHDISFVFSSMKVDSGLRRRIHRSMDVLAQHLANAVTLLNPDVLVIGGGVVEIVDFEWERLSSKVRSFLQPIHRDNLEIRKAIYGNRAGILGGIRLLSRFSGISE